RGPIASRQRRLARLVGMRLDRLPVDGRCRWIRGGIVAGVVVVMVMFAAEGALRAMFEPRRQYSIPDWWSTAESRREDAP
ncbi:MAG TPA: hypothetical protein PKE29_01865, partial [Phycisphaerales bacterium]|nr:hypothetical protein [Phycisphaerales bacterium]